MKNLSYIFEAENDGFDGNINAYIVSVEAENYQNWILNELGLDQDSAISLIESIKEIKGDVLIIKNINIEEDYQGEGWGTETIENILQEDFKMAFLIADISETQINNLVLESFYESRGFKTLLKIDEYPLMVYPESICDVLDLKTS